MVHDYQNNNSNVWMYLPMKDDFHFLSQSATGFIQFHRFVKINILAFLKFKFKSYLVYIKLDFKFILIDKTFFI